MSKWKIVSNYNMDIMGRFLKRDNIATVLAPSVYNNVYEDLFFSPADADADADFLLVWLDINIFSTYGARKESDGLSIDGIEDELQKFLSYIENIKSKYKKIFFVNWDDYFNYRGDGTANYSKFGASYLLDRIRLKTAERYLEDNSVLVLDFRHIKEKIGNYGLDEKLYYVTKCPFSTDFLNIASAEIKAAVECIQGLQKKLLVLDLDNTLWGGIIGDDGLSGVRLGGHDSVGESFVDFQKEIKKLACSGYQLAICSKNFEAIALATINDHPEMVLKKADFVSTRINWQPKSTNISKIVEDINIGLQSVVFLDDSPYERAEVSESLIEVFVPELPEQPFFYKKMLRELRCFDKLSQTKEDKKRTEMYQEEIKRQSDFAATLDRETWLQSLSLQLKVESLSANNRERIIQLLNKTNQFNLSGRRFTKGEFQTTLENHSVLSFRCSDRFGEYGLIAVVIYQVTDSTLTITDFVMSCRVMARSVENAILASLVKEAKINQCTSIYLQYVDTKRNMAVKEFLDHTLIFQQSDNVNYFLNDLNEMNTPEYIGVRSE